MSKLEPPTVLTRAPPSQSPDLPPSPTPSDDVNEEFPHGSAMITPNESASTRTDTAEVLAMDNEERLSRKQKHEKEVPWREILKRWRLVLTLENSGSVARDHLASERTFLAYTRTSLTIASTGVALVQLFTLSATLNRRMERFARPLGAVMIAVGLFTLVVGIFRYFLIQEALLRGVYPVARVSTTFISFLCLALVVVVFAIIVAAR